MLSLRARTLLEQEALPDRLVHLDWLHGCRRCSPAQQRSASGSLTWVACSACCCRLHAGVRERSYLMLHIHMLVGMFTPSGSGRTVRRSTGNFKVSDAAPMGLPHKVASKRSTRRNFPRKLSQPQRATVSCLRALLRARALARVQASAPCMGPRQDCSSRAHACPLPSDAMKRLCQCQPGIMTACSFCRALVVDASPLHWKCCIRFTASQCT